MLPGHHASADASQTCRRPPADTKFWDDVCPDICKSAMAYTTSEELQEITLRCQGDRKRQRRALHHLLKLKLLEAKPDDVKSPDVGRYLQLMHALAMVEGCLGWQQQSEYRYRQLINLREEHIPGSSLGARSNLANMLTSTTPPRYREASQLYQQDLSVMQKELGHDSPITLSTTRNLVCALAELGEFGEAMQCLEQALAAIGGMHTGQYAAYQRQEQDAMLHLKRKLGIWPNRITKTEAMCSELAEA